MANQNALTRGVVPFSKDRLSLVARDRVARAAFAALHPNQDESAEVQVGAAALLFAAWVHRLGLDPYDLYQMANKMLRPEEFHTKANLQLETIRDFAGIRLAGDSRVDIR